jgi:hypothetical protein
MNDMAERKADGTYVKDTRDHMERAIRDYMAGKTTLDLTGVPAASQAAAQEAFSWGQWFRIQLRRNSI